MTLALVEALRQSCSRRDVAWPILAATGAASHTGCRSVSPTQQEKNMSIGASEQNANTDLGHICGHIGHMPMANWT